MARQKPTKVVKVSVLDLDDKYIPISLFSVGIGMMVIFTFIFPMLGLLTVPLMIAFIGGILTEGITYTEHPNGKKIFPVEEE